MRIAARLHCAGLLGPEGGEDAAERQGAVHVALVQRGGIHMQTDEFDFNLQRLEGSSETEPSGWSRPAVL